jgi:predicted nucleic acid-binding protein
VILLDTSGLLAALDGSQDHHRRAAQVLLEADGPFLLSPFVLAELDYLLTTRVGVAAELALLDEVSRGAYRLEPFPQEDVDVARDIVSRYDTLGIGLADASLVVLAARYELLDVLTLDERHFRALRDLRGRPFRLLPADHSTGP